LAKTLAGAAGFEKKGESAKVVMSPGLAICDKFSPAWMFD
jgi:hypothetical protein